MPGDIQQIVVTGLPLSSGIASVQVIAAQDVSGVRVNLLSAGPSEIAVVASTLARRFGPYPPNPILEETGDPILEETGDAILEEDLPLPP